MSIRYRVALSQAERCELTALVSAGNHPARRPKRAQILLAADRGIGGEDIATTGGAGASTVYRRRFVEANLEGALSEEPRAGASASYRQRGSPGGGDRQLEP